MYCWNDNCEKSGLKKKMETPQTEHTLIQSSTSAFQEDDKGNGGRSERNGRISVRMKAVVDLHLAGESPDTIADMLGYAGVGSVYQVLANPKVKSMIQQVMDYYDERFRILYPEVINAVAGGLRSMDEKVQLEASKIWLKSHGKHQPSNQREAPGVTIESLIANILIEGKDDSRSTSNREPVQDSRQEKTNRRFQIESQSTEV